MTTLAFPTTANFTQGIFNFSVSDYRDSMKEKLDLGFALEKLKEDIGSDLFASLSEDDRLFILETEGSVDLGYEVNLSGLKKIFTSIKDEYMR